MGTWKPTRLSVDQEGWPENIGTRFMKRTRKLDVSFDGKPGPATEYFCCRCRQLRLSCITDKTTCKHCGNKDLITGPVGSLDKEALIRKLDGLTE